MVTHIKGKTEHYISAERFMKKLGSENVFTSQIQGNVFRLYDFVHTASKLFCTPHWSPADQQWISTLHKNLAFIHSTT